jgi:hypothetical protein
MISSTRKSVTHWPETVRRARSGGRMIILDPRPSSALIAGTSSPLRAP